MQTIVIQLLLKLVSAEFICKLLIIGAEAWSNSTENKYDNEVVAALKKALES